MIRVGNGFDVHKFASNRKLILGGVEVDYELGLAGHSDADVLTHALCDALLGAVALGDIGKHFPSIDPTYKDISSIFLLKKVLSLLEKDDWEIGNVDLTIICEEPRLTVYIDKIRKKLAETMGIDKNCVSIKATTTETLGFTGRKEGIAALATVLVSK